MWYFPDDGRLQKLSPFLYLTLNSLLTQTLTSICIQWVLEPISWFSTSQNVYHSILNIKSMFSKHAVVWRLWCYPGCWYMLGSGPHLSACIWELKFLLHLTWQLTLCLALTTDILLEIDCVTSRWALESQCLIPYNSFSYYTREASLAGKTAPGWSVPAFVWGRNVYFMEDLIGSHGLLVTEAQTDPFCLN